MHSNLFLRCMKPVVIQISIISLETFVFETVKYCSISSLGEVAGFNCRRERLSIGDVAEAPAELSDI